MTKCVVPDQTASNTISSYLMISVASSSYRRQETLSHIRKVYIKILCHIAVKLREMFESKYFILMYIIQHAALFFQSNNNAY